eukprot:568166-Pyramimonas_sp.AAC.1
MEYLRLWMCATLLCNYLSTPVAGLQPNEADIKQVLTGINGLQPQRHCRWCHLASLLTFTAM